MNLRQMRKAAKAEAIKARSSETRRYEQIKRGTCPCCGEYFGSARGVIRHILREDYPPRYKGRTTNAVMFR